ncbi:MAG TPA: SWIM zinc finger family protein [Micromonospora sp.]|nr:SWIM zinc finger family protein [Micromonospora sp.]
MSFPDYDRPRRVEGGLRARSTRGPIGRSWWSRRFLDVLESFALGTRLTRGRSYARAGQVLSLDIAPGTVTAVVQGSRATPYRVAVGLPPFPEPVWARIEQFLADQALYSARLLAGDLPSELEQVFAQAGAPLFPAQISELDLRCNCPDFAVPCKHLAATFYLLAEAFDADPFQILHWRGRDRERLLMRLRALRTGEEVDDTPSGHREDSAASAGDATADRMGGATAAASGAALALADLPAAPLAEAVDRFWLPPVPLPARTPTLATAPDLLLRQLGPPPASIGGPGLLERLRRAYENLRAEPLP